MHSAQRNPFKMMNQPRRPSRGGFYFENHGESSLKDGGLYHLGMRTSGFSFSATRCTVDAQLHIGNVPPPPQQIEESGGVETIPTSAVEQVNKTLRHSNEAYDYFKTAVTAYAPLWPQLNILRLYVVDETNLKLLYNLSKIDYEKDTPFIRVRRNYMLSRYFNPSTEDEIIYTLMYLYRIHFEFHKIRSLQIITLDQFKRLQDIELSRMEKVMRMVNELFPELEYKTNMLYAKEVLDVAYEKMSPTTDEKLQLYRRMKQFSCNGGHRPSYKQMMSQFNIQTEQDELAYLMYSLNKDIEAINYLKKHANEQMSRIKELLK